MGLFMQKSSVLTLVELVLVVSATILLFTGTTQGAALPGGDDERYEKEYPSASSGAHELATWLIAQLHCGRRQNRVRFPFRSPATDDEQRQKVNDTHIIVQNM